MNLRQVSQVGVATIVEVSSMDRTTNGKFYASVKPHYLNGSGNLVPVAHYFDTEREAREAAMSHLDQYSLTGRSSTP